MARVLNRKKPFGKVERGSDFSVLHTYEQDGFFFNHEGKEMDPKTGEVFDDFTGDPLEVVEAVEVPSAEPEKKKTSGLTWDPAPRLITLELNGEIVEVDTNKNNYSSRDEIKRMLRILGAEYKQRDSRKALFKKLMDRAEELEREVFP